jgi:hypothetical protein
VHQARNNIKKFALPFPITSIYLVPKDNLTLLMNGSSITRSGSGIRSVNLKPCTAKLVRKPKLYWAICSMKRIIRRIFRTKFRFEHRYLTLGLPGKTSVLNPEIYEREKEKVPISHGGNQRACNGGAA